MQTENSTNQLPTSTLAIISLIAGILGMSGLPLIGSAIAIFTGLQARKETRAVPPVADGDNLATIGIVLGCVGTGLFVMAFCCYALWFGSLIFTGI